MLIWKGCFQQIVKHDIPMVCECMYIHGVYMGKPQTNIEK